MEACLWILLVLIGSALAIKCPVSPPAIEMKVGQKFVICGAQITDNKPYEDELPFVKRVGSVWIATPTERDLGKNFAMLLPYGCPNKHRLPIVVYQHVSPLICPSKSPFVFGIAPNATMEEIEDLCASKFAGSKKTLVEILTTTAVPTLTERSTTSTGYQTTLPTTSTSTVSVTETSDDGMLPTMNTSNDTDVSEEADTTSSVNWNSTEPTIEEFGRWETTTTTTSTGINDHNDLEYGEATTEAIPDVSEVSTPTPVTTVLVPNVDSTTDMTTAEARSTPTDPQSTTTQPISTPTTPIKPENSLNITLFDIITVVGGIIAIIVIATCGWKCAVWKSRYRIGL